MLIKEFIGNRISVIIKEIFGIDAEAKIENSKLENAGDYSTNIAMVISGKLKRKPIDTANELASKISEFDFADNTNVTAPGFINFRLNKSFLRNRLVLMSSDFERYIKINIGNNKKYNIEFVSANPTGPLNVVNARAASTGAALANLLNKIGFQTFKEFYINDAGNQIEIFGNSVRLRYLELFGIPIVFPENHYQGDYVIEISKKIKEEDGDKYLKNTECEQKKVFKDRAREIVVNWQKRTLEKYNIYYDKWYSEYNELHLTGKVYDTLEIIKNKDLCYQEEGAVWLKTKQYGDEKDRALKKNNGLPTYFLTDIAYHKDKFDRGFDYVLDLWGPDHHGHIKRTEIALKSMGLNAENFKVMIIQQVNFIDNGEHLKMSKRKGQIITLDELMNEIPDDVSKFFFLMRNSDSHLDFDIQLAKTESNENPVYYIQYAYARIRSIFRKFENENKSRFDNFKIFYEQIRIKGLNIVGNEEEEKELIKTLTIYPEEIKLAALTLQPHRITNYLRKLAGDFHSFYNKLQILNCDNSMNEFERLVLVDCVSKVIKDGLTLLNISSPEKM
ncbi:arginine--tRNA ligase [Candidatus Dependentiae bacterium]|nr:arginine--tRNA ligase [Candidatus Dependentiae bacterium]